MHLEIFPNSIFKFGYINLVQYHKPIEILTRVSYFKVKQFATFKINIAQILVILIYSVLVI